MRRTIWICRPPTVATSTSGTGISPATPDHKAKRSTKFDAISSRVSGVLAAMASLVSELDDVGFCAMADPFLILERDQHLVVSACFSAQTPRGAKSVSCALFDAKRLRLLGLRTGQSFLFVGGWGLTPRGRGSASAGALPAWSRSHRTRN